MTEIEGPEDGPRHPRGRARHGVALVVVAALLGVGFYGAYNRVWGTQTKPVASPSCVPVVHSAPPTAKADLVYVNVFNDTDHGGLADDTARRLEHRGFHVISVRNDPLPRSVTASAEVRFGPNGKVAANTVAAQLKGAKLVEDHRADPSVDLALGPDFKRLVPLPPAKPGSFTLNVYNTTYKPGLAGDTAAKFSARGFKVGDVGNDPAKSFVTSVGVLRYGDAGEPAARRVALQVKGLTMAKDDRTDSSVDLVIGAKFDQLVPKAKATVPPTPSEQPTLPAECRSAQPTSTDSGSG